MSRKSARLKYPAFAAIAGAACVVALSFANAQVTSPEPTNPAAVKTGDTVSGLRSAPQGAQAAKPSAAQAALVSGLRSAPQGAQAAKLSAGQVAAVSTLQSAPQGAQAAKPSADQAAAVSGLRSAPQGAQAAKPSTAQAALVSGLRSAPQGAQAAKPSAGQAAVVSSLQSAPQAAQAAQAKKTKVGKQALTRSRLAVKKGAQAAVKTRKNTVRLARAETSAPNSLAGIKPPAQAPIPAYVRSAPSKKSK